MGAGWDALTVQFASRFSDKIKWLVESGIVVSRNDEAGIRYLLEHGADPRLGPPLNNQGPPMSLRPEANSHRILNHAAAYYTPEIFALLLSHGPELQNATPLHHAAGSYKCTKPDNFPSASRIPMLEYLVELRLDINALDDDVVQTTSSSHWGTPLHYAVRRRHIEEVKWLLDHGADPDKPTFFGTTPRSAVKRLGPDHELAALSPNV
ncbi:ankyrin [Setomelanomma holmii]|uniref:Ankyrin n=1 Tax=Setomelanomma holmii TaxID=210430 RepID=A0A9P4HLN5_9PLEO|nr:ankyrin [Setomelanomma holmii]